ncbi:MAG: Maf family protein [Chloroflexota bacterium]
MNNPASIILASNSPRRKQLLALNGWNFQQLASNIDESLIPGETPPEYVRRLAGQKALAVIPRAGDDQLIIGSDTIVVIDGDILGKPENQADARNMLVRLRGVTHQVFTGIAVIRSSDQYLYSDVVSTNVPMRNYSDDEIDRYIQSGDPMDKAGAYGIQNPNFQPVEKMSGCYASVMGLPLCSLSSLLKKENVFPVSNIEESCQVTLSYQCPVSHIFLQEKQ